jgi:hypothetical protein
MKLVRLLTIARLCPFQLFVEGTQERLNTERDREQGNAWMLHDSDEQRLTFHHLWSPPFMPEDGGGRSKSLAGLTGLLPLPLGGLRL